MHAELSYFVIGSGHHAPSLGRPADNNRLAGQRRIIALLDGCVEGIHIDMENHGTAAPRRARAIANSINSGHRKNPSQKLWPWPLATTSVTASPAPAAL